MPEESEHAARVRFYLLRRAVPVELLPHVLIGIGGSERRRLECARYQPDNTTDHHDNRGKQADKLHLLGAAARC